MIYLTYKADHIQDTVLNWMSTVDGELQVQLLLLDGLDFLDIFLNWDSYYLLMSKIHKINTMIFLSDYF